MFLAELELDITTFPRALLLEGRIHRENSSSSRACGSCWQVHRSTVETRYEGVDQMSVTQQREWLCCALLWALLGGLSKSRIDFRGCPQVAHRPFFGARDTEVTKVFSAWRADGFAW